MSTQNEYLLLFRGDEWYTRLSPEELQKQMGQVKAWFERLTEEGKLKAAQPLVREGKIVSGKQGRVVADGPFAESKEAIGGYLLLAVNSLDEAVAVAQSCPSLEFGSKIEVRPVAEDCPMAHRARQLEHEEQLATA
jgi:hypothetical protein